MKKILKSFTLMILMLAAVFAVACGPNPNIAEELGIMEMEATDIIELAYWDFSQFGENQIIFRTENENAVCICTAEKGYFVSENHEVVKSLSLMPNKKIHYQHTTPARDSFVDFVKIVVKEDEHIIGYAVIKVTMGYMHCVGEVVKSALFPQVDGEFQNVTQEQIDIIIENFKK